jgi:hypothetical protein
MDVFTQVDRDRKGIAECRWGVHVARRGAVALVANWQRLFCIRRPSRSSPSVRWRRTKPELREGTGATGGVGHSTRNTLQAGYIPPLVSPCAQTYKPESAVGFGRKHPQLYSTRCSTCNSQPYGRRDVGRPRRRWSPRRNMLAEAKVTSVVPQIIVNGLICNQQVDVSTQTGASSR